MTDEISPNAPSGGLVGSINQSLQEGLSQRAAMERARSEQGLAFSNSTFRTVWANQQLAIADAPSALSHPMDQLPTEDMIREDNWGSAGSFYTWVRMQQRTVGTADIMSQYMVVRTDAPVSPDEAIETLLAKLSDAEQPNDTGKNLVYLGAEVWGWTQVPPLQ